MYVRCHVKYPLLLSNGNETNFLDTFEKSSYNRYYEIRQVGAELLLSDGQADGRTDRYYEANSR